MASKTRRRTKKKRAHRKVLRFGGWAPVAEQRDDSAARYYHQQQRKKDKPSMFWLPSYLDWKVNKDHIPDSIMGDISAQFDSPDDATRNLARERLRTELRIRDIYENPDEYLVAWKKGKHKRNNWVKWATRAGITTAALLGTGLGLYHWGIPGLMNPLSGGLKNAFAKAAVTEGAKTGADKVLKTLKDGEEGPKTLAEYAAEEGNTDMIDDAVAEGASDTSSNVAENVADVGKEIVKNEMKEQGVDKGTRDLINGWTSEGSMIPNEAQIDIPDSVNDQDAFKDFLTTKKDVFTIDPTMDPRIEQINPKTNKIRMRAFKGGPSIEISANEYHQRAMAPGVKGNKAYQKRWEKNFETFKTFWDADDDDSSKGLFSNSYPDRGVNTHLNLRSDQYDGSELLHDPSSYQNGLVVYTDDKGKPVIGDLLTGKDVVKSTFKKPAQKSITLKNLKNELRNSKVMQKARLDKIASDQARNLKLTTTKSFAKKPTKTIEDPDEGLFARLVSKIGLRKRRTIEVPEDYDTPYNSGYRISNKDVYSIPNTGLKTEIPSEKKSVGLPYTQITKANALVPYTGPNFVPSDLSMFTVSRNPPRNFEYLDILPRDNRNLTYYIERADRHSNGRGFKVTKRGRRLLRKYRRHTKKRSKH